MTGTSLGHRRAISRSATSITTAARCRLALPTDRRASGPGDGGFAPSSRCRPPRPVALHTIDLDLTARSIRDVELDGSPRCTRPWEWRVWSALSRKPRVRVASSRPTSTDRIPISRSRRRRVEVWLAIASARSRRADQRDRAAHAVPRISMRWQSDSRSARTDDRDPHVWHRAFPAIATRRRNRPGCGRRRPRPARRLIAAGRASGPARTVPVRRARRRDAGTEPARRTADFTRWRDDLATTIRSSCRRGVAVRPDEPPCIADGLTRRAVGAASGDSTATQQRSRRRGPATSTVGSPSQRRRQLPHPADIALARRSTACMISSTDGHPTRM